MTFDEYEASSRKKYAEFAAFVAAAVSEPLAGSNDIRLQHVQHRSKDPQSLRGKLEKLGIAPDDPDIESKIKDLAGCRLVFYTNADVSRFVASGQISELFDIDWERTKFHHPTEEADDEFRSDNVVVRLKEKNAARPDLAKYRGLSCEVQIQTALNHAWSEMSHDLYKHRPTEGFGTARTNSIRDRMRKIMREHLLPAGYEFQKIRDDFDRLASGKELFDQDALAALAAAKDNNQRVELLERFSSYALPDYDDPAAVQADIRKTVADVMRASRATPVQPIETQFGQLEGMTADHVFDKAIEIVNSLRYAGGADSVQETFDLICELYRDSTTDSQRKKLLESAEHLAENQLDVWRNAGPIVQHVLAERILSLDLERAAAIRPVLLKVLGELLNPEVTGISSTYKTVTWTTGAVEPSDALVTIRSRAIEALKRLFHHAKTDGERLEVMQGMWEATRMPNRGTYSDALLKLVLENTLNIVSFYADEANGLSFELLQKLEHTVLWIYRRNREMPKDAKCDAVVRNEAEKVTAGILRLRDSINRDPKFVTYKVLVGFESVFPQAWDEPDFDYEEERAYRERETECLVDSVKESNADEWFQFIWRCVSTESSDLATFQSFGDFIEKLGTRKPSIALRYLEKVNQPELEPIIPGLLKGLESSDEVEAVGEKITAWIEEKRYLGRILWYYRFAAKPTVEAVRRATTAAIKANDCFGMENAVEVMGARYKDLGPESIDSILLPAIDRLEELRRPHWVGTIGLGHGENSPFRHLTEQQAQRVLKHLVQRDSIGIRLDQLLGAIGQTHPRALVDFFGSRVRYEREIKGNERRSSKYEAIPFRLHAADKALKQTPDYLLASMRSWYNEDSKLFSLRAGRLAHSAYQEITPELAASMLRIVQTGDAKDLEFIVEVLERFEGADAIHPIYKAIVSKLEIGHPLLRSVSVGINATGVVSGEFGFVEAYKLRRAAMQQWLEDPDEKVRHFAERQIKTLDHRIASEQRRAEEDMEMRKRTWGTNSSKDEPTQ